MVQVCTRFSEHQATTALLKQLLDLEACDADKRADHVTNHISYADAPKEFSAFVGQLVELVVGPAAAEPSPTAPQPAAESVDDDPAKKKTRTTGQPKKRRRTDELQYFPQCSTFHSTLRCEY